MRMESKYVKRRQRGLAVLVAALVLIIGAVTYIGVHLFNGGSDYKGAGNGNYELVEIPEGSSLSELGPELEKRKVVATNNAFQSAAFSHPNASRIEPGFYRLQQHMSAAEAVNVLLDPANKVEALGIPGGATLLDVTVVKGNTRKGIYSMISDVTCTQGSTNCIAPEELQKVAGTADPSELGVPEWAVEAVKARGNDPKRLEGLIVPGTYIVNPTSDAKGILNDLITRGAKAFESTDIQGRADAMGIKPYDLLTAASLVEREAPAGDFDKVARVILNRLAKPMRLEFDSTVNYGLSEQEVATTDEDRGKKTAWNTYAMEGLPATPIASPSKEAIDAMENPATGDWLYFVTTHRDGTTVFSNNFDDHQRATRDSIENGVLDSNR